MRAVAAALAVAAAVMAVLAFTTGGDDAAPREPAAAPPAASERSGLAVWAEQGCGSCHTLARANSHGFIGPDLGATLKGVPASYIRDSIVAPNKAATAGFAVGVMPEDYAARIRPADLDRLVEFLHTP